MNFDWYGAEAEYRRALQLAPNDAQARAELAFVLAYHATAQAAGALAWTQDADFEGLPGVKFWRKS